MDLRREMLRNLNSKKTTWSIVRYLVRSEEILRIFEIEFFKNNVAPNDIQI
jgi:hypothetical protein